MITYPIVKEVTRNRWLHTDSVKEGTDDYIPNSVKEGTRWLHTQ